MENNHSPDMDDDGDDDFFNEVYGKEYTGPPRLTNNSSPDRLKATKRPLDNNEPDEEDEAPDPNGVPTDFTSREAKVWEAKAKAIERNWKKRKEEELICKICGETGHFTQGCPSTLGANWKSADFFERVPARDKHVRSLFSEKVIQQIEKDIGCKIRMDEKFLIVSGKDRLVLAKGVDAVHRVIQGERENKGKSKGPSSSHSSRSKSPDRSPAAGNLRDLILLHGMHLMSKERAIVKKRLLRINCVKICRNCQGVLQKQEVNSSFVYKCVVVCSVVLIRWIIVKTISKCLMKAYPDLNAFGNNGVKRRPAHSKSPPRPTFAGDAFNPYDVCQRTSGMLKGDRWEAERHEMDVHSGHLDLPVYPQTLEELEAEFKKETLEIVRIRDKEEDEEIYRHRELIRELTEKYMKKLESVRGSHAKQWEEFLELEMQIQQRAHQHLQMSGYCAYNQTSHLDFEMSSGNLRYPGGGPSMDPRGGRYQYSGDKYPASSPREAYGEFQHQRREDFGKAYDRY